MKTIASIAVDNNSKSVDRLFDYIVPDELIGFAKIGARVVVPFGRGNKYLEGYIIALSYKETDEEYKLKSVIDIVSEEVILDEDMLELAYYIKNNYHCTFNEALKTLIPQGINLKENIYILKQKNINIGLIKPKYIDILKALDDNKYTEYRKLNSTLNGSITRADIYKMERMGYIKVQRDMKQNVSIKKINLYSAGNKNLCKEFLDNHIQRDNRQAEVLRAIIENNDKATLKEICKKYKCSQLLIKKLVDKGLIIKSEEEVIRKVYDKNYIYDRVLLTSDQRMSIQNIFNAYKLGKNVSLIFGVTGCGKTEIYLNLAEKCIKNGAGAIILVPEISLTPQTVERFKGRFGNIVAVMHSRLSDGERYDEWRKIKSGEKKVVVGARSAVFAPVKNLKLIIVDEEHEYSYKSESIPKYDTRDIARYRINKNNGLLILGSATPSLESYHKAETGEYNLVTIRNRINNCSLPEVKIIDMRNELMNGNKSIFSLELFNGMKENLENGYQTILFLNRRGHSTFISCRECGYVVKCNNCDVSMTYHLSTNKLSCHYCGMEKTVPHVCPKCGSKYIKYFGIGTERIESELKKYFPQAKIIRMDMDTTRKKGEYEKLYNQFKNNNADVLIGTQMISKGMDFKNVSLVGIISADTTLNLPDFRSAERTFQLLTQVSGRSGRGDVEGKVIVQTYDTDHYSILCASKHNFESFYLKEIKIRRELNLPPFANILYITFSSENERELINNCMKLKQKLCSIKFNENIQILGPTPCYISKIKNSYRWHMFFKGNVVDKYELIEKIIRENMYGSHINYSLDINPYNMF